MDVATHVKPSLDIIGDVFIEIVSLDVINQEVSVHVTQLKIHAILWLHVVIMELIHDDLTQIKDDLPEVDGFVHYDSDLPHLTLHKVLAEDNSQFEVQLRNPLEIHLLIHYEIDIPMLPDVLHHLPKHRVVHELVEVLLKVVLSPGSKFGVNFNVRHQPCTLV